MFLMGTGACGQREIGFRQRDAATVDARFIEDARHDIGATDSSFDSSIQDARRDDAGETAPPVTLLAAGDYHTCALRSGKVRCWGQNFAGQLGYAMTQDIGDDESPDTAGDVDVPGYVTQIVAGAAQSCALNSEGEIYCWGSGLFGKLGYGDTNAVGDDETPSDVGPVDVGAQAIEIAAGGSATCAVLISGELKCWGFGGYGSLGYGNQRNLGDNETPMSFGSVALDAEVVHVECGATHTCAILSDGVIRCWGSSSFGQLGIGEFRDIGDDELPNVVGSPDSRASYLQVSAGYTHVCGILQTEGLKCWGSNLNGELGYGNTEDQGDDELLSAVAVISLPWTPAFVSAGGLLWFNKEGVYTQAHTCAVSTEGEVRCWGNNDFGQLGYGHVRSIGDDESIASLDAVDLGVGVRVVSVSVGGFHSCASTTEGEVFCWGGNAVGQLGYGNTRAIGDDETPASAGAVSLWGE